VYDNGHMGLEVISDMLSLGVILPGQTVNLQTFHNESRNDRHNDHKSCDYTRS
jgi:hypothetical protein